ncbi:hypothetical protein LINPERHAP2_LOCUS3974 [Linum perenne]
MTDGYPVLSIKAILKTSKVEATKPTISCQTDCYHLKRLVCAAAAMGLHCLDFGLHGSSRPSCVCGSARPQISPALSAHMSIAEHYDESLFDVLQKAAFGIIVTNSEGQVWDGRSRRFLCSSAIVSKARALLEAVGLANCLPLNCTILYGSKMLVDELNEL